MNGSSKKGEACPQQLLDLVSKGKGWFGSSQGYGASSEENKLELTLGPPGEHCSIPKHHQHNKSTCNEEDSKPWASSVVKKEPLLHCNSTMRAGLQTRNNDANEKRGFLPSAVDSNTAVPSTSQSQKRAATAAVVGWPPIRSCRKNLASTSTTKASPNSESENATHAKVTNHGKRATEAAPTCTVKGLYVKVNMDGIPIGRKLNLNAYDNYEKLSSAVDQLFRGLLAVDAQSDMFANGISCKQEEKLITGLLDGSGEYTLVYEDNEGDRVLVGDVPWCMFVSTVKRLRVLKTADLSSLTIESKKQKIQMNSPT